MTAAATAAAAPAATRPITPRIRRVGEYRCVMVSVDRNTKLRVLFSSVRSAEAVQTAEDTIKHISSEVGPLYYHTLPSHFCCMMTMVLLVGRTGIARRSYRHQRLDHSCLEESVSIVPVTLDPIFVLRISSFIFADIFLSRPTTLREILHNQSRDSSRRCFCQILSLIVHVMSTSLFCCSPMVWASVIPPAQEAGSAAASTHDGRSVILSCSN